MMPLNEPKQEHPLDQIGDVHWHLVDLCAVVLFNIAENLDVVLSDKVDGNTLATETSRTTNTKMACWKQKTFVSTSPMSDPKTSC